MEALDLNEVVIECFYVSNLPEQVWSASSIVQVHFCLNVYLLFVCSVCLFLMDAEKKLKLFCSQLYLFFCIDCLFYSLVCD